MYPSYQHKILIEYNVSYGCMWKNYDDKIEI